MKIKLDENLHGDVAGALAALGHDVATAQQENLAGHPDADVAAALKRERRCLATFDLDFADTRVFPPREFSGGSWCCGSDTPPPAGRSSA